MADIQDTTISNITLDEYKYLDGVPDAVILVDAERRIVFVNEAASSLFNSTIIGRDLSISVRHPSVLAAVDEVLKHRVKVTEEVVFSVPIPRTFSMYARIVNLRGGETGGIIILRDFTSIKLADQMRQDFVANVSHELRSPISALVGIIETLQGIANSDSDTREKFLKIMSDEAARMSRLIDDLLALSRVEVSEHVIPDKCIDVRSTLENTVELLNGVASEAGISIRLFFEDDIPAILGDRDELTEVFQNLIENGIKYGEENSEIQISLKQVDRVPETNVPGVCISFKNRGDGIEEEHLPRLTERFYRTDEARSRNTGGTGLGLAIVKHIVSRHRGHLSIESFPGDTTTVSVILPLSVE